MLWHFFHSVHLTVASYLDTPRIYFSGQFQADVTTVNNYERCFEYHCPDFNNDANWNPNGTGEFYFFDTNVYGAVNKDEEFTELDLVIGATVLDNGKSPFELAGNKLKKVNKISPLKVNGLQTSFIKIGGM